MSVTDRLSMLSPEQRALFEKLREKQRKAVARPPQPPPVRRITGSTAEGDWPLSLDQERFWFMEQLYPGHAGLNITAATRMRGPMSVPAMAAGLDEIAQRHAAWRTTFPMLDGRPVQRVGPARRQTLALLDLSGLPEARREPEMLRLLEEATAAPFDLERETLVRSGLARLGPRDHVCLLTIHHLVTDWISFQIAFGELAVLYAAFAAGGVSSEQRALPEPSVQYPDFAAWQREWLQGEVLEGLVSWWRERLAEYPLTLELPTDRPRPAVARMRGGRRVAGASRELSEALRSLGRREGATLFMTVLALVAALFHRLSGQEKLILGANNANRNRPELGPVLGCFLTQVPFPIDLAGDPPVRELLARVRQSALGSLAHQDLPFGKLVEALEPERDPGRQPVIQALVQVLDGQASKVELAGMTFEPVEAHDGIARYDLFLTLFDYPDGLSGSLEYDADLFDATTAERLAELLFLQAARATADPDLRLSELPVLSEAQAQQALVEWNDTARPLPDQTLPELFAARAKRAPEATAVVSKGGTLTYGELDRRSDELAYRLVAAGVEPGSHVALLLGRTADVPVAIFGCWKAGAAYVPLDPEWPAERLALVLEDAEPAALVHRGALGTASDVPSVDLDDSGPVASQTLPAPDPYRLAYLIYTSGTTGRPKAVMVEHRSAAAMAGCILDLGVGPDDRVPHLSRYTFDVTLLEIVLPLAAGGVCEIVDTEEVLDPEGFLAVLERSTRVFTLPALLRRAVDERGQRRFAGLRTLASGGDLVPPDLLESMLEAFPSTDLLVLYGPTETTIICTGHRLSRARKPERALIGRPLANVEARVVDPGGRPVALGVPGELWIGGPGVARGYFQRQELTAERFVRLDGQPDGRPFYRTGDLVRQVPGEGGELEFLGRIDAQVKIRGIRIEPGEIEAALRDHPGVRDAAVIAVPAGGDKQLVAYVVGTDDAEALRAFLRERLPEAMIPSVFVPLEAIPITSHGKVDRKALPAPQAAREVKAGAELPRNAREELLAGIWRDLLGFEGVERVGVHDNFFRLGGDSILSIQVVARARRAGLLITTRQFFDNQTIAGLAAVATMVEASTVDEGPVEGEAPLTPVQRRFFEEEPSRFNMAVMLAPRERLDRDRLAAALTRLAAHHDALRLRFVKKEDGWRQIHSPDSSVPLLEIDRGDLDAAAEQLQSGLDLARGPLFTAALFRRAEGDRLLLTAHHLIVDGVSWRVLLEDLAAAYRGQELPPKTTSWKRWAERLNAFASEVTGELPYWQSLQSLRSLPSFPPVDPKTAAEPVELGAAATRALLQEAPEAYHTQVNDLLLTALARACGESTLLVDLEGHGREEIFPGVDLSRTVGWFTTTFPVALTLPTPPDTAGPRESILAVKETLRAVPRRGLGYGLLRYVNPETSERLAALPEPRVSFNYLGQLDASVGEGELFGFAPEAPRGTQDDAKARLAVDCMVVDGRLRVICASERLARGFVSEVEALVAHCLSPEAGGYSPSDFPLARVDQAALDRLLGADRNVEDLYPLAPLQEGILFHSAHTPGDDPYFQQFTAELEGPLDVARFTGAWQSVLDRHPALRTAFLWRQAEQPLELVRKDVELPWTLEDQHGSWQDLLAADRARGFDLERAPLMRLTVVRTAETSHRLIWSSHHLIFDGWCLSILLSEVFALYQGRPLPPPPRPYRDYIAWLAQRDAAEAEGFWRERLEGFTEPTPLPFDRRSAQGDPFTTSVSLPAAALGALAQRLQVTVNTLVQGAWALLLSRYAQVSDVLFGAVVSGRPAELPGVESMIGLFINTLPVRIAVPAEEPASAWLARVQEAQPGLAQHQWTPLARIQSSLAKLGPGEALFESLLVFENYPMAPSVSEGLGELRIAAASLDERTNYPLTLIVVAREELTLRLVANRRFEPATARRLLSHLERLLEGLAADPASPPLALPLLSEAERHQATVEWNDTSSALPPDATIHGLFARQAARTPDAVAVEMGEESLTYAELQERAARIARHLVARGLRPGQPVSVLAGGAERSPELVASLLGILQAGGAYLPLDPSHPLERLEWMVRDAGARWLEPGDQETGELPEVPSGSLAYVMYTSGSTGTPKGVGVTHRNVIRLLWNTDFADMGPDQVWLQYAPVAFDASTLEIWAPLLHGGRLVLFPGRMGSLDELARVIERHGVTSAWLTAGLFHEMVDGRVEGLRPLRQLLAGGDVVSPEHARRVLEAHPGLTLVNGYGPTENTTFTACHRMTGPRDVGHVGDTVPVGRPIVNTRAYVLDGDLRPVPVGAWGELYAGGEGVARGYLGRPDLTAELFVPDPWEAGARLYRTGDLVRWRGDGVLELLGRRDAQVKIRGFRVEPAEVEAALLACPGVQRAAVVVAGEIGDRSLRAFWVGDADADELRARLRAGLPEAMVPSAFVPLPDLPLTPNGKVDRRALAALEVDAARRAGEGLPRIPPRTVLEERLAEIWSRVLEVDDVGAFDNFFDLGGHSLLATQLVTRIRDTFGVELPVSFVFEAPTLAAQAAGVAGARGGTTPGPILRLSGETGDVLPVSFAQERLWFLQRFDPASPAYNIPLAIRLSGDLDVAALESAFDGVVRRHETLRATFHEAISEGDGDGPVQRISPALRWTLPFADLSGLSDPRARQAEVDRLGLEDALAPFDLLRGPMLRTRLLRLAPREHILQLCIHHVAADLWSMNILVAEVAALYEGRELPPLPLQYSDFAAWQRDWLQGGELERQIGFWRRELAGAPPVLDLPTDRPRPQILSHRGSSRPFELGIGGIGLSDTVARFAREHEATPFMVLLAALGAVASRWSGQDDLVLGTPVANRQRPELERLIGLFVNSLPMRVRLEGRPSFADLLDRVRSTALAAYEHQDVPFEKLVEELRPPRSLSRHPLFQVLLAFQNVREERLELPGLVLEPLEAEHKVAKFDLALTLFEARDGLVGTLEWATDLFDAATVERLDDDLKSLLTAAFESPETPAAELPMLTGAASRQLLVDEEAGVRSPVSEAPQDRLAGLTREQRAALFEQLRKRKERTEAPADRIPRRSRETYPEGEPVPASFAQERLWFLDRLAPGKTVFNMPMMLRITGGLSPAHLERVLGELVRRHETLRTTFGERDGQPVQIVAPAGPWTLPVVDLSGVPHTGDSELRRLAQDEVERPFDLETGPLLRAVLLRFSGADHALLLDMHHIVSDGWSLGVLVRDITALYAGSPVDPDGPSPLAPLPIQYADFAAWQRGWLRGEVLEKQIAWWREALAGAPASLDLPTDRPRPATQTYLGARFQVPFDPAFSRGLAQFARRHEATPYMVFLAAFQALLGRLSGQDDLAVGSPIANRNRSEVEPLIGFFVNTLVMRGDLRGDPPFRELLARARRSTLGAYAHQDLPFERLVMELRPERHLSVTPLFQAVCAMQNAPVGSMDIPGLSLDRIPFEITTSQFDLELHLWEIGDAYVGDLSYSTELFDGATILRLVAHLETLLRAVMADPGLKLSDLPLLPESERHQILHEWNDTSPPLPFRERGPGGEGPDLLAMILSNAPKPLLDRAARLAGELRSLGVGPDVPVGLCVERSPELVTGALAVLLAGGAYLPMDPAWPEDRLAFVLQESGMPVLLVRGVRDGAPAWATGVKVIDLDRPSQADPVRPLPPDPDRLAYVIYTSGSTGRPKGVQVPHRGLLSLVRWHLRTYGVTREDRATLVASPAFDASVWEIWPYLAAGASLHVPGDDLRLEPERLLAWMVEEGITLSFLPTPLAEQVLDVRPPDGLRLRALLTGGDRLQQAPGEPLPFALVNHYGPTESSVVATCAEVEPGSARSPRSPGIGRPIDGTRVYVVDSLLQAVPIGTPGELVLAGAGLARGYLARPDLTADRFIPDPFSAFSGQPGGRLYRTGDLVRLLPDGSLDFLGRVDTQVKLRGFRIELGEIESALLRHPAVREAVVTLHDGAGIAGIAGIAAYVVCRPEAQGEAEEHVSEWQTLYDETYARSDHRDSKDATFDIEGWNSSYTGQPIPAVEMREWVESTVERILALHPRRVVEIGCGTGLLLFRVAPHTESYLGIDFSRVVLQALRRRLAGLPQVTLRQGEADDWTGIARGEAADTDLVILNSVSQYFPGIDYLVRVLEGAVSAVKPGGAVFVGDVRSLPLLEDFAESVERFQAPPTRSEEEIQRRIRRRVAEEEELVVDPAFFQALAERVPGISGVDLLAKEGRWDNELTRYRYDVVLHAGNAGLPGVQPSDLPWSAFANDPLRTRLARRIVPELRRHLQSELPDYMVPSSFVLLDALPVTANGKVDRAALPEPEPLRPMGISEEGTPPGTPEEKTMAGLWKEVLGVDEVRLEDNFFGLGGHSLLATQLVSRIRATFGVDLPLRRLFEKPTLGDLTASLDTAGAPAAPAPARRRRTEAPLSLAQERFWYFGRTGNTAYNVASPLRLRGPLDEHVLERCFREVIRRHDTLRTRFVERNGTGIQLIDPPGPCGPWYLPRIDLQGLADREREAIRLVREGALRPFDIVRGPLLRVALVRLGADDHVLILNCHHIVVDGWSMGVLVGELMELYRAFAAGEPSPLADLPVQYPDLAAWQRERLAGGVLEARLDWWRETLKGAPRIWSFPLDRPRSASSTHRGAWILRVLPAGLADRLKALGTTEGASLYMVVLAGLSLVLRSWTGQEDLVVGSPLAGRERGESERMIGVFLNLLPMRIDLSGAPTFRELLRRARRTALEAYTHQEVSFEALVAALGLKREPTHNPIFQCTLNMLNFPSMGGELPGGVDVEPIRVGEVGCKYDFTLYGTDTPEGLTFNLLYAVDLFDRWRMEALQNQLREVLELAVEHPDAPIRQFPASAPNVVA